MQTRTKKTLATGALGLAFAAAAAATGAASAAAAPAAVLGGSATNLVPGVSSAQSALENGTNALPADPSSLLPSGNHLDGNQVAPVSGLLGGLPLGG